MCRPQFYDTSITIEYVTMKYKVLCFAAGLLLGALCVHFSNRSVMGDERTVAQLYPKTVALRISHDVRVLTAIRLNEIELAKRLVRQDIDGNMNTLLGIEKFLGLDEHERNALRMAQEALNEP